MGQFYVAVYKRAAGAHELAVGVHPHDEHLAGADVLPIRDRRPCHASRLALASCPRRGPGWRRAAPPPHSIAGAGTASGLTICRTTATRPLPPSAIGHEPGRLAHTRCPVAARGAALAPWCEGPWVVPCRHGPSTTPGTAPRIKGWDHRGPTGPISRLKRGTNVGPRLWS